VDYERVYSFIQETLLQRKSHLIETLASLVARGILREFPIVDRVVVRVRKPHPPVKGVVDYVEVEIAEHR
jgi:dihydroneopterin aldolase